MNYEPGEEKSYVKPVAEIQKEKDLKTAVTKQLKSGLGKMRKRIQLIVIRFCTVSRLRSPEENYINCY